MADKFWAEIVARSEGSNRDNNFSYLLIGFQIPMRSTISSSGKQRAINGRKFPAVRPSITKRLARSSPLDCR